MSAGFDPSGFWDLTPRELAVLFKGAIQRTEREHNQRAWLAWHTAALGRTKKLPKLEKLLARQPRRRQTWQEQAAIMERWAMLSRRKLNK